MDLIGNYSSQQSLPGPGSPQNVTASEGDENVINTSEHAPDDFSDNIYMTQESEDDGSGTEGSDLDESDAENSDGDPDTLTPPPYSLPTPPAQNSPEVQSQTSNRMVSPQSSRAQSQSEPDEEQENLDALMNWDWIPGDTLASTTQLDFQAERSFMDFPEGEKLELQYFMEFLTNDMVKYIVDQSNLYQRQVMQTQRKCSRRMSNFQKIQDEDIWRMLAVQICMGIDKKPTQANYWSNNPFYKSEIVPKIMTGDRFKEVHRFIHFCDNEEQTGGDRLHKIRHIWELFNERIGLPVNPGQNICIDESLVLYKGNLFCKQYIPSKAAKFGIKLFSIADSEIGYILNVMIYEGKGHTFQFDKKSYGFGGALVLEMAMPYLNVGRCVYIDNYFVNVRMARELLDMNTNVCGTLRKRLKLNPKFMERMKKGQVNVYSCNGIMVEQWRDKKEVRMLSTGHSHQMIQVRTRAGNDKVKPQTVLSYNKLSRSIDKMDMVTGAYDMNRKSTKWYKKLFFKIIEICLYNAKIIFTEKIRPITLLEFKENVVLQILEKYGVHKVRRGRKTLVAPNTSLADNHFPEYLPLSKPDQPPSKRNQPLSRNCVVCCKKKKRSQTRYQCSECCVALCRIPCFKKYHKQ